MHGLCVLRPITSLSSVYLAITKNRTPGAKLWQFERFRSFLAIPSVQRNAAREGNHIHLQVHCPVGQAQELPQLQVHPGP